MIRKKFKKSRLTLTESDPVGYNRGGSTKGVTMRI